jgi:hypothetical protein
VDFEKFVVSRVLVSRLFREGTLKRVTRRILFSAAGLLAFPRKSRAMCCVNMSGPVTAYTPTFDPVGCAAGKRKPSYGGKATFIGGTGIYMTTVTDKAELYEFSGSGNDTLMASKNNSSDPQCGGVTTQVSVWTTAPACIATSAFQYFGKFTVTYYRCPNGFSQTDFNTSTVVQCP